MARRLLSRNEVLLAVLASDRKSESDFDSDDSDKLNTDDESCALQDTAASGNLSSHEDSDGDISSTVSDDSSTDDSAWYVQRSFDIQLQVTYPSFLHPFSGATGIKLQNHIYRIRTSLGYIYIYTHVYCFYSQNWLWRRAFLGAGG